MGTYLSHQCDQSRDALMAETPINCNRNISADTVLVDMERLLSNLCKRPLLLLIEEFYA